MTKKVKKETIEETAAADSVEAKPSDASKADGPGYDSDGCYGQEPA